MYIITVEFLIKSEHASGFQQAVTVQARNSATLEPGCRQFDVSVDPKNRCRFFLYEVYDDPEAFEAHKQTPHFAEFGQKISDWVESKTLNDWNRFEPAGH